MLDLPLDGLLFSFVVVALWFWHWGQGLWNVEVCEFTQERLETFFLRRPVDLKETLKVCRHWKS